MSKATTSWMEHVGGKATVKNIGADAGMAAFFALGGYLTSDDGPLKDASPGTKRLLNAVFAVPIMAGIPGVRRGVLLPDLVEQWREREVPDFLMTALSTTIGALGIGMNDREMINSAAMLAALFAMAGHLEDGVMEKSQEGIEALEKSVPAMVRRRVEKDGKHLLEEVELHKIMEGDHVVVPEGHMVPVDGKVVDIQVAGKNVESGAIKMPDITHGERSMPEITRGAIVPQGAIAADKSHLVVQATAKGADSTILRNVEYLRNMEEGAQARSVHSIKKMMNNVYIPVMMAACATQFVASYYHDKKKHVISSKIDDIKDKFRRRNDDEAEHKHEKHGTTHRLEKSVKKTAEIAIKMAPCAITASMLVLPFLKNKLALQHGVVVREDKALERAKDITHVLTDVRGTLTKDISEFHGLHIWDDAAKAFKRLEEKAEHSMLSMIGKAEVESDHPIAKTLRHVANERKLDISMPANARQPELFSGRGVAAEFGGDRVVVGKHKLLAEQGHTLSDEMVSKAAEQFGDVTYFAHKNAAGETQLGIAAFKDVLRDGVVDTLHDLRKKGTKVVLVTGMPKKSAEEILQQLEAKTVKDNPILLRADHINQGAPGIRGKDDVVREFAGKNHVLAAVGDGVNDAAFMSMVKQHGGLSLAISDTGRAATKEVASMVVEGIHQLPDLMSLSKKLSHAMIFNVSAAASWMTFLIASHVFGMEMKPEKASIAHEAPTFLLTIASLAQSFRLTRGLHTHAR